MHYLSKPNFDFQELFMQCVSNEELSFQQSIIDTFPAIKNASEKYDREMSECNGHEIEPISEINVDPEIATKIKNLYSNQFVSKNGPGRNDYDKLLIRSKKDGCCFCSYEDATELDHFLPKSKLFEFSIFPLNLVPICNRCNKKKSTFVPKRLDECFIHPYFEDYSSILWLDASVYFDNDYPVIRFGISNEITAYPKKLKERLGFQIEKLSLKKRYGIQAAREISGRKSRLKKVYEEGKTDGVREFLYEEADSFKNYRMNSWQTALYTCLYKSDRFCKMQWQI